VLISVLPVVRSFCFSAVYYSTKRDLKRYLFPWQAYERGLMIAVIPFTSKVFLLFVMILPIHVVIFTEFFYTCVIYRFWNPANQVLHIGLLTHGPWVS
jgi:hypothetical protein